MNRLSRLRKFLVSCAIVFYLHPLIASQNSAGPKYNQQTLISHVNKSIENANNEISQLNKKVLRINGMSSPKIRHLLNNLCSLKGISYLEIGSWKGSTLVAAAYGNEENFTDLIAIDNWSQFGSPRNEFICNITHYLKTSPIRLYEENCFNINKEMVFYQPVNVYFYDGAHTFLDQKKAFTFFNSVFDDIFVAVVDDWNWECVRDGTFEAFKELEYQVLFEKEFFTNITGDTASWWNGLYIAVIKK